MTSPTSSPPVAASFLTTRWTRVCRAKADSADGRRAMAELCEAYYEPVITFLRCELRDAEAAREMGHAFFAQMLAGTAIAGADQARGRFRSYLLGAARHFLSHQREAARRLKRGSGAPEVSLDDEQAAAMADGGVVSPDAAFDRRWALTVLARALEAVAAECAAVGQGEFFEKAKPWLTGDAAHGDQAALAESCGMSAAALKMAVHRLKQRFRRCVRAEVAGTLEDEALVEEEMRTLFAALGG